MKNFIDSFPSVDRAAITRHYYWLGFAIIVGDTFMSENDVVALLSEIIIPQ